MPRRTFILLIAVIVLIAIAALLVFALRPGGLLNNAGGGNNTTDTTTTTTPPTDGTVGSEEPGIPPPPPTPVVRLESVVVVNSDLPVGTRLTRQLLDVENRPNTNIALQGGYTFADISEVEGRILRVDVAQGEALLRPMLALEPNDLTTFGSDLALYVDRGEVAIAFPIDEFTGASLAMRPGDLVDMLMTVRVIEIDPEFKTALPNGAQRVIESALLEGEAFLFPEAAQGRLEFIPAINQVVEIIPGLLGITGQDFEAGRPIPKRATQLTIQQAEVLWVGTWQDPRRLENERDELLGATALGDFASAPVEGEEGAETPPADGAASEGDAAATGADGRPQPGSLLPERFERTPDVVILSMSSQDALALKWARERGVNIDIALRGQGDNSLYTTTTVSLYQIIEQGGLVVPPFTDFDLHPAANEVDLEILAP